LVVGQLQDKWQALRTQLFPSTVLLELSDQLLTAQRLPKRGQPLDAPWTVVMPGATLRHGQPLEREALGDFIGDLLLSHGEITAHLSVVLPVGATHWRLLEWPAGGPLPSADPEQALEALRQRNPDLGLPFGLEQAYLDWIPLPAGKGLGLLVAIERTLLDAWLEVFSIAGVKLDRLVPLQVAVMAGLADRLAVADPATLVAVLLPDYQGRRLLVWRAGLPLYERRLPADPERLATTLPACLRFLQEQEGGRASGVVELVLVAGVDSERDAMLAEWLQQQPGLALELPELDGYGSLAVQGLAALETLR